MRTSFSFLPLKFFVTNHSHTQKPCPIHRISRNPQKEPSPKRHRGPPNRLRNHNRQPKFRTAKRSVKNI